MAGTPGFAGAVLDRIVDRLPSVEATVLVSRPYFETECVVPDGAVVADSRRHHQFGHLRAAHDAGGEIAVPTRQVLDRGVDVGGSLYGIRQRGIGPPGGGIAVVALVQHPTVDADDVAYGERRVVGNTVHDDIVGRRTQGRRKAPIVEKCWHRTSLANRPLGRLVTGA